MTVTISVSVTVTATVPPTVAPALRCNSWCQPIFIIGVVAIPTTVPTTITTIGTPSLP